MGNSHKTSIWITLQHNKMKTFPVHSPMSNARFRSSDLRPFFPRDHTWTKKLRMVEKKNPKTTEAQTTGLCRYARVFRSPSSAQPLCPRAGGCQSSHVVALLLNAWPNCWLGVKLFWKLYTRTILFWLRICHTNRLKKGHLFLLVLPNAITSSNLPFKPLVWALTSPFKAKCTRLAHRLNSRTQYDWKEIGISYKFKLDGRSKGVETSREKWKWVAGTVLQMSLVNITAGQRILLCLHSNVYIWLHC